MDHSSPAHPFRLVHDVVLKFNVSTPPACYHSYYHRCFKTSVMMLSPPSLDSIILVCRRKNVIPQDSWMRHDPEFIRRGRLSSMLLMYLILYLIVLNKIILQLRQMIYLLIFKTMNINY